MVSFYIINLQRVHQLHNYRFIFNAFGPLKAICTLKTISFFCYRFLFLTFYSKQKRARFVFTFSFFLQCCWKIQMMHSLKDLVYSDCIQISASKGDTWRKEEWQFAKDQIDIDRIIFKYFQLVLVFLHPQTFVRVRNNRVFSCLFGKIKAKNKRRKKSVERKKRKQKRWIYDVVVLLFNCDWTISFDLRIGQLQHILLHKTYFQQLFERWFLFPSLCRYSTIQTVFDDKIDVSYKPTNMQ